MGTLYLIPTTLGETDLNNVLPLSNTNVIKELRHFIVENIRTARRFLKQVDKNIVIDDLHFYELNKHTDSQQIGNLLKPIYEGHSLGIISEAGCPAIADPGADVVALAQTKGIKVVPLVGPSSILLSIMASGFNGQNFAFCGYLPIDKKARTAKLKQIENRIFLENQTQIFIETPYRNNQIIKDIIENLKPNIKLCIASELTTDNEFIKTLSLSDWKKEDINLNKKTAIFLLYK